MADSLPIPPPYEWSRAERRRETYDDWVSSIHENDRGVEVRYRICRIPVERKFLKYDHEKSFERVVGTLNRNGVCVIGYNWRRPSNNFSGFMRLIGQC